MFNQILGSAPLFMDELFFQQMAPFIIYNPNSKLGPLDFLQKEKDVFYSTPNTFLCDNSNELSAYSSELVMSDEAYLFVLHITGVMFPWKYDYYKSVLSQAEADKNVIGIVVIHETPGGAGYGLNEASEFLQNLSKPYYSYVKCACSAGYWLASSKAVKVIMASKMSLAGSIGSMVKYQNFSGYYKEVLKSQVETLYAEASSNKNEMGRKMEKGDDSAYIEWLGFHNNFFLEHVIEQRGVEEKSEVLKGGIYYGQDAVEAGLADGMMNESDFFDMVRKECIKHALSA